MAQQYLFKKNSSKLTEVNVTENIDNHHATLHVNKRSLAQISCQQQNNEKVEKDKRNSPGSP